jgi:hypothetical protein
MTDPQMHGSGRFAFWLAELAASNPGDARHWRKSFKHVERTILSAGQLASALREFPESLPVLLWTAPLWREHLSFWWLLDAVARAGLNLKRFEVAEPRPDVGDAQQEWQFKLAHFTRAELLAAFDSRVPLSRRMLREGRTLWRKFASASPAAFDAARRKGSPCFPDLVGVAEMHGSYFPQADGNGRGGLRLSALDQVFLGKLQGRAWVSPHDCLYDRRLLDFLLPLGDLILPSRLSAWAAHAPDDPVLLTRQLRGVNVFTNFAYRLTPRGRRIVEQGLASGTEAPPLAVGGCRAHAGRNPWVRRADGNGWRLERLFPGIQ